MLFIVGFICPVHTPDGAPCGLLNHITALCQVTNTSPPVGHIPRLLSSYGMIPLGGSLSEQMLSESLIPVMLNGRLLGRLDCESAQQVADQLRMLKVQGEERVRHDGLDRRMSSYSQKTVVVCLVEGCIFQYFR